ncbi:MAG: helix-turn-helix domain-containing protein [Rhodobacteraceae bacterium]|nr:helix-turn-helix domain-containing protein [Paracoccaceae bacterium]
MHTHYSSFRPNRSHGDTAVLLVQRHIEAAFPNALSNVDLADVAGLTLRTFLRRFDAATGYSPANYVQNLRIEKARGALERSNDSAAEISWSAGYQDISAFSRVFKSITGLTPGTYRARFRVANLRSF